MDIKEIALKLLAKEFPGMRQENKTFMVEFAEALIESYKAELLKEAGEPFGHIGKDILGRWNLCLAGQGWKDETAIYTADQLIAATKPLEDQLAAAREEIAAINRDKKALTNRVFDLGCQLETVKSQVSDACAACVADQDDVPLGVVGVLRQGLWREYMPETTLDEAEDQLAKAEQRVAKAWAELADKMNPFPEPSAIGPEILSGEWRKFVKGE